MVRVANPETVVLPLTPMERQVLDLAAREAGMGVADLIRSKALLAAMAELLKPIGD